MDATKRTEPIKVGAWDRDHNGVWERQYADGRPAAEVKADGAWRVWLRGGALLDSGFPDIVVPAGRRVEAGMKRADRALRNVAGIELEAGVTPAEAPAPAPTVSERDSVALNAAGQIIVDAMRRAGVPDVRLTLAPVDGGDVTVVVAVRGATVADALAKSARLATEAAESPRPRVAEVGSASACERFDGALVTVPDRDLRHLGEWPVDQVEEG